LFSAARRSSRRTRLWTGDRTNLPTESLPWWVLGKPGEPPRRFGHRIVGNSIDQSDLERPSSGNFFGGDEEFQRWSLPNQAGQTLRSSPARDEAEGGAAMSENRVRCGNPMMTSEREIESPAHTMAFYGRNHWPRVSGDRVHEGLSHSREVAGFLAVEGSNLIEVGSYGEKVGIAGDNERRRGATQFVNGSGQGEHTGARKPVGAVRRDEAQNPG
jgi:hypothetical protein